MKTKLNKEKSDLLKSLYEKFPQNLTSILAKRKRKADFCITWSCQIHLSKVTKISPKILKNVLNRSKIYQNFYNSFLLA